MGLILRTTHENLPVGATVSSSRLSIEQMDNNLIFLQSIAGGNVDVSVTTLTVASASQYMESGWITPGHPYLITDADPYLYGTFSTFGFGEGTNILLHGVDSKNFSTIGHGKFYNPIYDDYDVWNPGITYSVDDKVIYGGKVWNLTATASVNPSDYWSLQSDWEVVDYTDTTYYKVVWDEVEYNIVDNYITSRYDVVYNNLVVDSYSTWYFNCETHPIQTFRWGHANVRNCKVENSYFGCLNFVNGYISEVELKNYSMIWSINILNYGFLQNITLTNGSSLNDFTIDNGYFRRITLSNDSSISDITLLDNSYFQDITIINDSHIYGLDLTSSHLQNINISNDSVIAGVITMDNSHLYNVEISNNGNLIGSYETDDSLVGNGDITIENSSLENIKITNDSVITGVLEIINGSYWNDITVDNGSWISGYLYFNTGTFESISIKNNSKFWGDVDDIYINNTTVQNISLDTNSEISYLDLGNSTIQHIDLSESFLGGYNNNFTITNSTLQYLNLSNGSWFKSDNDVVIISGGSTVEYITLTNQSYINGELSVTTGSYLGYLDLTNESYFGYNIFITSGGSINNVKLDNSSRIGGDDNNYMEVYQNSVMQNIEITNDSYISGYIGLGEGSVFQNIKIDNNSFISPAVTNCYMDIWGWNGDGSQDSGSIIENITITNNSNIKGNIYLGDDNEGNIGYIGNVEISNGSTLGSTSTTKSINIKYGARLEYITINNFSRFTNVYLVGVDQYFNPAKMYYIDLNNYSYIDPTNLELYNGSEIKYLTLDNHSHIMGQTYLRDASKIKRVQMANYSKIDGYNEMHLSSEIQYVSMVNVSDNSGQSCIGPGFTDFYVSGTSSIHGLDMRWSTLGGLHLDNASKIQGLEIDNNSGVFNVYIDNTSSILNSKIINSYLDGDSLNPGAFGSLLLNGGCWMENVVFDTVDFPTWYSDKFGISLQNGSYIKNAVFKNMCANDRVLYFNGSVGAYLREGFVQNIYLDNNSFLENITIENSGDVTGTDSWSGYFKNVELYDYSYICGVDAKYAQFDTLSLTASSYINNLTIKQDGMYDLTMNGASIIYDLEIIGGYGNFYSNSLTSTSEIGYLKLNNSYFYYNDLSNSGITIGKLNLSDIDNCTFTNTSLQNFNLHGTSIYELNQDSTPISIGFDLKNIAFDFYNTPHTYSLTSMIGHNNTIKHQFTVTLDGLGNGAVSIPRYVVPGAGWYIEKAIIDCKTLVVSGTVLFNLGLHEQAPTSVLNDVDSTTLSNKVSIYDISNGGIIGTKSTGFDWIGLLINAAGGDSITTGTMYVEITLKNTNYFTTWWS